MQEVYFVEFRMKLYVQLMILFVISLIGEGNLQFHLPIPGSIIGFDYSLSIAYSSRVAKDPGMSIWSGISCWPT